MKKILFSIIVLALISTIILPHDSEVKAVESKDIQQDYIKTMTLVKNEIENGNVNSPEEVEVYQKFLKKYSEKDINDLIEKI